MQTESIELGFLSIFALITFFIFLIISKYSYEFEKDTLLSDMGEEVIIPKPIKDYALVNFDEAHKTC